MGLCKSFQNALFLTHTLKCVKRATEIGRERDGCNKRFSLVQLGGYAEATVISREFNITGMYFKAILFHCKTPRKGFVAATLAHYLSRYTQCSRMQPVVVARTLKVTEYSSSPRERTRWEAASTSFIH